MAVILFLDMMGRPRQIDQHRDDQREHQHVLERTGPKRRERFEQANHDGAAGSQRVRGQATDDGSNKALEADQEAAVVIDGGQRRHQQAGQRADQCGDPKGLPTGQRRRDAHQAGAVAVDGSGQQGLAGQGAVEEQEEADDQRHCSEQHGQGMTTDHQGTDFDLGLAERRGARAFRPEDDQAQADHQQVQGHRDDEQDQHRRFGHRLEGDAVNHRAERHDDQQAEQSLDRQRQSLNGQYPEQSGDRQRIGEVDQRRLAQLLAPGRIGDGIGGQRQHTGTEQQPDGTRIVAGFQRRHGQGTPGEKFALGNEDDAGDGEDQHQRQGQQRIDGTVGDAILRQQGKN